MSGILVRQTNLRLSEWGDMEIPVLLAEGGAYIPITHVCAILGGLDAKSLFGNRMGVRYSGE